MKIKIILTGRSYHSAAELPDTLELADGATLDAALSELEKLLGETKLPPSCVVAVSGNHVGTVGQHEDRDLADGDELVLVAPVAGG